MEDRTITITTGDGKEIVCDILFTHYSKDFDKNYVVFCDRQTNEASAAVYVETADGTGSLEQVTTDEEWEMLEELLEQYSDEQEAAGEGCSCGCEGCNGECNCEDENCDCGCEGDCPNKDAE